MSVMWSDEKIVDELSKECVFLEPDGDEDDTVVYFDKAFALFKQMRDEYQQQWSAARAHWWNVSQTDWADDVEVLDEFFGPEP